MSCREFESRLHPFVDGELDVAETLAAEAHAAECPDCRSRVAAERRFRQLLRRQPRESAPPEFRAMLRARLRRSARVAAIWSSARLVSVYWLSSSALKATTAT
mgnify:CR=1 FL=1